MNYDEQILALITAAKADKSIIQPWRNKAAARLEEAQAFIRMGKGSTNLPMPPDVATDTLCTCRKNEVGSIVALRKSCPVHGEEASKLLAGKTNQDKDKPTNQFQTGQ